MCETMGDAASPQPAANQSIASLGPKLLRQNVNQIGIMANIPSACLSAEPLSGSALGS
jgi:hypothetical protein